EATLPDENRTVRNLHAKEVLEPRAAQQAAARTKRLAKREPTAAKREPAAPAKAQQVPRPATAQTATRAESAPVAPAPSTTIRPFLKASDDVEAAPSIGPRSAQKLAEAGIFTVADLIATDPNGAGAMLAPLGIRADTLRLWQSQARLVMDV